MRTKADYELTINTDGLEKLSISDLKIISEHLWSSADFYARQNVYEKTDSERAEHFGQMSTAYTAAAEVVEGMIDNRIIDLVSINVPNLPHLFPFGQGG